MEKFQKCADLEINNEYLNSKNTLNDLMNLQKNIQEDLYGHSFKELQEGSLEKMKKFVDFNFEAIRDEEREFQNALGGVYSHGSSLWKNWKSKHEEAKNKHFSSLTEEELKELQMEWIDILHFVFNIGLAIKMDAEKTFNFYFAKNRENIRRQKQIGGY